MIRAHPIQSAGFFVLSAAVFFSALLIRPTTAGQAAAEPDSSQAAPSDSPSISLTTLDYYAYPCGESRDRVLSDFGFQEETPYYTYYDEEQALQLELFFDAASGRGCGFRYNRAVLEETPMVYGFGFSLVLPDSDADPWGNTDPYSVKSVYGSDGSERVRDYAETTALDPNGKPAQFRSTGVYFDDPDSSEAITLIQVEFTYRSDGSLLHKSYYHNPFAFGTTFSPSELDYDEAERLVFARSYITHGHLEYYYIYDGGSTQPAYCLCLDESLGLYYSSMLQL